MSTWLIDPALLKMSGASHPTVLHQWCKANSPSLFLSGASLSIVTAAIERAPNSRREALNAWFDNLTMQFADRIHEVDVAIFKSAGAILSRLTNGQSRHRLHDAILIATAMEHGHGLVTRRDGVFSPWMQSEIQVI
jgi:predicted nucleic acid-binding protein